MGKKDKKPKLAPVIAERMRLLAASLSDQGGGQYFSLGSSDRATAGVPEAAQRAIEELLYEKVLSHLHPTTVSRSVAVCDTCAMVRHTYMQTTSRQHEERLTGPVPHQSPPPPPQAQIVAGVGQHTRRRRKGVSRQSA